MDESSITPRGVPGATYTILCDSNAVDQVGQTKNFNTTFRKRSSIRIHPVGFREGKESNSKKLYFRMYVENAEKSVMSVPPALQELILPGEQNPILGEGAQGPSSAVAVQPKRTQVVDLYFSLPTHYKKMEDLREFILNWAVQSETCTRSQSSRFGLARGQGEKNTRHDGVMAEDRTMFIPGVGIIK